MKNILHTILLSSIIAWLSFPMVIAQTVSSFDDLPLAPDTYWDGSAMPNGTTFENGNAIFPNFFSIDFGGYWVSGWAYSSMRDSTTAGFGNLYSARTGIGYDGSSQYAVGTYDAKITFNESATGKVVSGFYVTNATVTTLSMEQGDAFAKKFGGSSGDDPDWFKLVARGYLNGVLLEDSVEFYLADYRFADNNLDYIIKSWEWMDLTSLGNVDSLILALSSSDTGDFGMNTPYYFCMDHFTTADYEVFAPPVGQEGTTAIHQDSSLIIAWATGATITRGYQDIADPSLGYADFGDSTFAIGHAGSNSSVSLGDGGSALLTFEHPIINGDHWDFAVFENSFSDTYLELAFVEVSSDGENFVRFPATSYAPNDVQLDGFGSTDATHINNFAGKYRALYGTPFDLEELAGAPGLDVNNITHVRIVDVVGSINPEYATVDQYGRIVNDPWPTPFPSSGFDLDGVGVIHSEITATVDLSTNIGFTAYPNPAADVIYIELDHRMPEHNSIIKLTDFTGRTLRTIRTPNGQTLFELSLEGIPSGTYFISVSTVTGTSSRKVIIQN